MNYLIGIDLGTSSTKTVLFDEKGEVIASASKDYPLYTPHNGWAEQKPEDWRDAALETITKVVKIPVSLQMISRVLVSPVRCTVLSCSTSRAR